MKNAPITEPYSGKNKTDCPECAGFGYVEDGIEPYETEIGMVGFICETCQGQGEVHIVTCDKCGCPDDLKIYRGEVSCEMCAQIYTPEFEALPDAMRKGMK